MAENEVEDDTYESMTVVELKEELAVRDLHTSGSKTELIERLEADDAAEAEETQGDTEEQSDVPPDHLPPDESDEGKVEEEAPLIDPPRVYSPFELPANTAAAQAFIDAHPEAVDTEAKLDPPERQTLAEDNIQDHVDSMAVLGVEVTDPRLEGTGAKERAEKAAEVSAEAESADEAEVEEKTEEVADAV